VIELKEVLPLHSLEPVKETAATISHSSACSTTAPTIKVPVLKPPRAIVVCSIKDIEMAVNLL